MSKRSPSPVAAQPASQCTEASHARFKASPQAWEAARLCGYQGFENKLFEFRFCPKCDSTQYVEIVIEQRRLVQEGLAA